MSGAEAGLVLGIISSCISIYQALYEIYETVEDTRGIPKKFKGAVEQLPLILLILDLAKESVKGKKVKEETCVKAKPTLAHCESSAKELQAIFAKTIASKDDTRPVKIKKAIDIKRKSGETKAKIEEILADLDLLGQLQVFQNAEAMNDIKEAVDTLAKVSDDEETQISQCHSGSGDNNSISGTGNINHSKHSGSGDLYSGSTINQYRDKVEHQYHVSYIESSPAKEDNTGNKHWTVLRRPSPIFTGYPHILQSLEQALVPNESSHSTPRQAVYVLSGMGGVGKSEVVLQFAQKYRQSYWGVFWVDCGSETSTTSGFATIARKCQWTLYDSSAVVEEVKEHLSNCDYPCLLILDNCDTDTFDYADCVPSGQSVSVVLTTRLQDCQYLASRNEQDNANYTHIDGLDIKYAKILLAKTMNIGDWHSSEDSNAAARMVTLLGRHPLAITIGGAYVRDGLCSLQEYPDVFEQRKELLLKRKSNQMRSRYKDIFTTFEMSVQALEASSEEPARHTLALLEFVALTDRQDIEEEIFQRAWEYEIDVAGRDEGSNIRRLNIWHVTQSRSLLGNTPVQERMHILREARAHLCNLSLLISNNDHNTVSVHPLIHDWAKLRISADRRAQLWITGASVLALSTKEDENQTLFHFRHQRHLKACLAVEPGLANGDCNQVGLCAIKYAFALHLYCADEGEASIAVLQGLSSTSWILHNSNAEQRLSVQHLVGQCLLLEGRYQEAIGELERVVKGREVLADNHRDRLESQNALANAYGASGQVQASIELLERVVNMGENIAEGHRDRLSPQLDLATAYARAARYEEAEKLNEKVVYIMEKTLKPEDPHLLTSQHNLALSYWDGGRLREAEDLMERVVKIRERTLAPKNAGLLASKQTLALLYRHSRRLQEAQELIEDVVEIREKTSVPHHPDLLASKHELAIVYNHIGRAQEAEELIAKVVEIGESTLIPEHPDLLASKFELANVLAGRGRLQAAQDVLEDVVRIEKTCLAPGNPDRIKSIELLATVYLRLERYDDASSLLGQVLAVSTSQLPTEHPRRLSCGKLHERAIEGVTAREKMSEKEIETEPPITAQRDAFKAA